MLRGHLLPLTLALLSVLPAAPVLAAERLSVTLEAVGDRKIEVIKALREALKLDLQAAKDLADRPPQVLKKDASREEAAELKRRLEAAGAKVAVTPASETLAGAGPSYAVILEAAGDRKIQVIKEVRSATGLGLKEAKDLVDGAPKTIKDFPTREEAEALRKKLLEAGGVARIREVPAKAPPKVPASKGPCIVVLTDAGEKKVEVIRVLRTALRIDLKAAKDLADGAPRVIREGTTKEEAETLRKRLEAAGAKVEVREKAPGSP